MADKLSWTELRRVLASRTGVNEKEANAFLSALNEQLVDALKQDKQVKINGLGTFRLQAVAARKSVNVTTGEEITIPGYNKVAFAPEAGLKELVEKGGGAPEAIDPIKKLGAQAEEIVDILGDLGQSPKETKKRKKPTPTLPEGKENKEPKVAEPESVVEQKPVTEPKPVVVEKQPVAEPKPVVAPKPVVKEPQPQKQEKPKKKYHFLRDTLICVVILLLLLLLAYFFLRDRLSGLMVDLLQGKPQTEQVEAAPADPAAEQATPGEALTEEQILAEFLEASGEAEDEETPDGAIYEELITIEPMHEASRLAWMSKRYYGDKAYWPYLYDANKDKISNPSKVAAGTPIRVPKLTKEQLDTTSVEFRRVKREAERALSE